MKVRAIVFTITAALLGANATLGSGKLPPFTAMRITIDNSGSIFPLIFIKTIDEIANAAPQMAISLGVQRVDILTISDEVSLFNPSCRTVYVPSLDTNSLRHAVQAIHPGLGITGKRMLDSAIKAKQNEIRDSLAQIGIFLRSIRQSRSNCSAISQLFEIGLPKSSANCFCILMSDLNTTCGGWDTSRLQVNCPVLVVYTPSLTDAAHTNGVTEAYFMRRSILTSRFPNVAVLNASTFEIEWEEFVDDLVDGVNYVHSIDQRSR